MRNIILLAILCAVHIAYGKRHDKTTGRSLLRKRSLALTAPVNSLVDDVSEATPFRDRASKLRQLSQAGEMYPEHGSSGVLSRRRVIPKKARIADNDDEEDDADKKFKIRKGDDDAEDDKDSSDDSSDNDSDDESGSGDEEDDNTTTTDDDKNDEAEEAGSKKQCHTRCKTPLTFHQCAFPRCSQKLGTIKDLCFFLCKHQKEKCEKVCH